MGEQAEEILIESVLLTLMPLNFSEIKNFIKEKGQTIKSTAGQTKVNSLQQHPLCCSLVSDTPPLWKGLEPEQRKDYQEDHSSDIL